MTAANEGFGKGRLSDPDGCASVDNPLCGDRVTVDTLLNADGTIKIMGHVVRGCLLCEACASLLAQVTPGANFAEIRELADSVQAFLRGGEERYLEYISADRARYFTIFEPVRAHKSRHHCVLLPLSALIEAFESALSPSRIRRNTQ